MPAQQPPTQVQHPMAMFQRLMASKRQSEFSRRSHAPPDPSQAPFLARPKPNKSRTLWQDTSSSMPEPRKPPSCSSPEDDIVKQPETKPISQEQLIAEVKGIYTGLVMVESKCIEVDNNTSTDSCSKLNNEQWQALIALHRTLLHEHHDFFLASQHPSASPALRRLASKYAMPARMWRHGIHSFLELFRRPLPLQGRGEHMLTFIYLAYSMMALLYETVPAFEDTWIECLGDLGRYRMAIEDDSMHDREVWTSVSRHRYSKASDKSPAMGRLYHHLAILARPNALQQLHYYTQSLCVAIPFESARDSILTLFDPILNQSNSLRLSHADAESVHVHALFFSRPGSRAETQENIDAFFNGLDASTAKWRRRSLEAEIDSRWVALLGYGDAEDSFTLSLPCNDTRKNEDRDVAMADGSVAGFTDTVTTAIQLVSRTVRVIWGRLGDPFGMPTLSLANGLLKSRQGKTSTMHKLAWGMFLAHGIPLAAAALTLHPALRISSGVAASISGVTVIPLRTNGGFPAWSWILLWAAAFSAYLCLQTLRIPGALSHRRQLYLFCVIMAGLHLTIAISQGSDSVPNAFAMYGPILLTASAFLMALLLGAIHPGGPAAAAGDAETPPDGTALVLGAASLGFGP